MKLNRIYQGDWIEVMREWPDDFIQCCITSPPYWGLRDYGVEGQLGLEKTPEEYIEKMVAGFREVRRVLRPDGTLWLNMGDSYAGSPCGSFNGGGFKDVSARNGGRDMSGVETSGRMDKLKASGLKPKDLCGIPWRVALALQADGVVDMKAVNQIERIRSELIHEYQDPYTKIPNRVLKVLDRLQKEYEEAKGDSWYLRMDNIWHKPNPMPESCTDRPTKSHEYIFLLTKSAKYFYDADAVREMMKPESVSRYNYPFGGKKSEELRRTDNQTAIVGDRQPPAGRNLRSVWTIPTQSCKFSHFATFPEKLVNRCILAGTAETACGICGTPFKRMVEKTNRPDGNRPHGTHYEKDRGDSKQLDKVLTEVKTLGFFPACEHNDNTGKCIVFDPFSGTNTVGYRAQEMGRGWIGIELKTEYKDFGENRVAQQNCI